MQDTPVIGIIGGSGIYEMEGLEQVERLELETPFGRPSSPVVIGLLEGKRVAFLARHGLGHTLTPSEVPYRANIYALKMLGVQNVVGVSACGSLRDDYEPGHFAVPHQLIDFTRDRPRTFFGEGLVAHVGVADPFCPALSQLLIKAASQAGAVVHNEAKFITIEGPRFSTRGESNMYRSLGMDLIGMTSSPEAFLAREAELCYSILAHITDYDVWHLTEEPVTVEMVLATLSRNAHLANQAVRNLLRLLPAEVPCECSSALASALITNRGKIPAETRQKLGLLVDKYLP